MENVCLLKNKKECNNIQIKISFSLKVNEELSDEIATVLASWYNQIACCTDHRLFTVCLQFVCEANRISWFRGGGLSGTRFD